MRRVPLLLVAGFLLTLLACPSPAAEGTTDWVCTGGSVETCVRQNTDHSDLAHPVTVTAQFRDDDEVIDATVLTIYVNGKEAKTATDAGEVVLTYPPGPDVPVPRTDTIFAVGIDGEIPYQTDPITHIWSAVPVLEVTAAPNGTSGEAGSSFVVRTLVTLDDKPLRDAVVSLKAEMQGQPPINRTATSDSNGSARFTYTRQVAGEDEIVVTAASQDRSASIGLLRHWLARPPSSPPPSTSSTPPPTRSVPPPTSSTSTTPESSSPSPDSPESSASPGTPSDSPTPIRASLDLSPNGTSTTIGRYFTVTASLTTRSGDPMPGRQVAFETTKAGEAAITRTATTDEDGHARFVYRRSSTGPDSVQAQATVDGTGLSERIDHQWVDRSTSPAGSLRLDSEVVNPGSDLRLSGSGCPANGPIELSVGDVALASTRADGSGAYRVVAPLPELPLGRHRIVASCAELSTTATVDVVGVTAAMGTAGAAAVTTAVVLAFFVLLGGSIVRGLGNLGIELPFR